MEKETNEVTVEPTGDKIANELEIKQKRIFDEIAADLEKLLKVEKLDGETLFTRLTSDKLASLRVIVRVRRALLLSVTAELPFSVPENNRREFATLLANLQTQGCFVSWDFYPDSGICGARISSLIPENFELEMFRRMFVLAVEALDAHFDTIAACAFRAPQLVGSNSEPRFEGN